MREGEDFSDFEIFAVTINENYNVYLNLRRYEGR